MPYNQQMKILTLLFMIYSLNSFSATTECAKELFNNENVTTISDAGARFTPARVTVWDQFFGYDKIDLFCIGEMDVATIQGKSGKVYVKISTNTDECDGGNVYGVILDMSNDVVVEISDGGLYCPN